MPENWEQPLSNWVEAVKSSWSNYNDAEAQRQKDSDEAFSYLVGFLRALDSKLKDSIGADAGVEIKPVILEAGADQARLEVRFFNGTPAKNLSFKRDGDQIVFKGTHFNLKDSALPQTVLGELKDIFMAPAAPSPGRSRYVRDIG